MKKQIIKRTIRPARFKTWTEYLEFLEAEMPNLENYSGVDMIRFIASDNQCYNFNLNTLKRKARREKRKKISKIDIILITWFVIITLAVILYVIKHQPIQIIQ